MSAPPLSPCAELVRRGDPDRFASALLAPPPLRARLFALYAFNLELARIPAVVSEPMLGLMRLQWWRDAVAAACDGAAPGGHEVGHEVCGPLAATIRDAALPRTLLERLLDARALDIAAEPFADLPALSAYLRDTGGALMALAAHALDDVDGPAQDAGFAHTPAEDTGFADNPAEDMGFAHGAAAWLTAAPALAARGWAPFPPGDDPREAAQALAREGLAALARGRAARGRAARGAVAAYAAGWWAQGALRACLARDYDPAAGPAQPSPFRRRAGLLWVAATGRW